MTVDIIQEGDADDTWAVQVGGEVIPDLTGLGQAVANYHAALIRAAGSVIELPDRHTRWIDTGSGPGWSPDD